MSPVRYFTSKVNKRISNGMRILIVTGSSGGHIFPALSFLEALRDKQKKIDTILVLPKRNNIEYKIIPDTCKIKYLSIYPIELQFNLRNLLHILKFLKGSLQSLALLIEFRPDIVVGFGSLACVPLLLFAWLFRIKTLIHEQNVIPGRANRLLAKFVDIIAISFAQTKNYLKISQERIILTGNPIRRDLKRVDRARALEFFGFDNDKFTILIMGGSQGSHRINTCFFEAVSGMPDKSKLQLIHITGVKDYALLENNYKQLDAKVKLFAFLEDMQYAYSISDLAICRGGATTIAELMNFTLPAIIIPFPFAYKHQMSNAEVLEKMGTAIVINDSKLNSNLLGETLLSLINNPDKLKLMRSHYVDISKPNASDLLVDEVLALN